MPLLEIKGLKTHFKTDDGWLHAVDGVDLAIDAGETVGVVGESGCGKSVMALTVLKLIAIPPGKIVAGQVLWQGRDLVPLSADAMCRIRAKEIAIIFQEPMTSLNPVYTVGQQIAESTLSFLGLGFPPDIPTWGRILYDSKDYLDIAPHWALFPGLAIFLTVLTINFVGDGLRDALDPRRVM